MNFRLTTPGLACPPYLAASHSPEIHPERSSSLGMNWKTSYYKDIGFLPNQAMISTLSHSKLELEFIVIDNLILKCMWKFNGSRIAKLIQNEEQYLHFHISFRIAKTNLI